MTSHEERMAMLAGRDLDALDADERAQVAFWVTLLGDRDLWAEPPPDLEDHIVASVATAVTPPHSWFASTQRHGSWVRPLLAGLAVAAAIVAGVVFFSRGGGRDTVAAFALSGTELAPKAHGEASAYKDSAGFRIELKAHDLPALDGGRFYQAWLKGDKGLIPIGTFSRGDGTTVTLWSGASPVDYPTLSVTIEEPDGNQASSGHRVLAGSVSS